MMSAPPLLHQQHTGLTGLRGLAALLVLLFHYFDGLVIFRFGWLGVDILFVLCGFLITGRLLENRAKGPGWFLWRRLLRIVPIYFITLAVYFWLLPLVATPVVKQDILQYRACSGWYFSFLQNWLFVTEGYPAVPHLAFLWSLGIQVQFYLLMAVLVGITGKLRTLTFICTTLLLVSFILRLNIRFETEGDAFTHYMYNAVTRLDSFMAGALAYIVWRRGLPALYNKARRVCIAALALLVLLLAVQQTVAFTGIATSTLGLLLAAIGIAALLLLLAPGRQDKLNRFFAWRPLVFTGRISYGLYMYHVLVFVFLSNRIYSLLAGISGPGLLAETGAALVCMAISFGMAWLSWRWIERPLMRMRN